MQVVRLTIDLIRPVPIAPLEIETKIIREGKKIQLSTVHLAAGGVEVVRASILKIRSAEYPFPEVAQNAALDLPLPKDGEGDERPKGWSQGFMRGISYQVVRGRLWGPGPAAVWYRADQPIIAGSPITSLMRAAITADFSNGTSSVLDYRNWSYINSDLTVHLARLPAGEWILLDARTTLGTTGSGIACARMADCEGYFGQVAQSLVLEPR